MTKIDTKEILDLYSPSKRGYHTDPDIDSFVAGVDAQRYPELKALCNAYDEAQKDIQCFKVLTWQQNQRISTLEGLLREVLEIDGISKEDKCQFCNLSYHSTIRHTMNCVFTRIQKELRK